MNLQYVKKYQESKIYLTDENTIIKHNVSHKSKGGSLNFFTMVTINFSKRQWSEDVNSVGFTWPERGRFTRRAGPAPARVPGRVALPGVPGRLQQDCRAGLAYQACRAVLAYQACRAGSITSAGPGRLRSLLVALSVGLHGERVAELAVAGWTHRTRPAHHSTLPCTRSKIWLVESNTKCRYIKKLTKGLCGRRLICLRPPLLSYDPILPLPYTLCACWKHQHDWRHLQSINCIKHQ